MTRNELFEELKRNTLRNVYLFYGQEAYLISNAVDRIKNILAQDDSEEVDYISADGKTVSDEDILDICCSVSFIATRKIVVVDNYAALVNKEGKVSDQLLKYLDAPEDTVLIFVCTQDIIKSSALYKKLTKTACCVDFSPLTDKELQLFVKRELDKYGKKIGNSEIEYLIQYTNTELNSLTLELNKLALACDENVVKIDLIEEIITPSREYKIFKLTDYILDGNRGETIKLLDVLLAEKEEPIFIVAVLSKTFHNCLLIKDMLKERKSVSDMASLLGVKDFVLNKLITRCNKLKNSQIVGCNELLLDADSALKSSTVDERDCITALAVNLIAKLK